MCLTPCSWVPQWDRFPVAHRYSLLHGRLLLISFLVSLPRPPTHVFFHFSNAQAHSCPWAFAQILPPLKSLSQGRLLGELELISDTSFTPNLISKSYQFFFQHTSQIPFSTSQPHPASHQRLCLDNCRDTFINIPASTASLQSVAHTAEI